MAKCFETWTVLPHEPIEKLGDNLWSVEGTMPGGKTRRRMTVARLEDGGLVIHNAIALDDAEMAELEAFGEPRWLVVPNGFHRQDAAIYKQRYPKLRVLCPSGAKKAVGKIVAPDGSFNDFPSDARVSGFHLRGAKEREGALVVRSDSGATVVFNDMVLNMKPIGGAMGFFLAPEGRPCVPRFARWFFVSDRAAFRSHLEELAATPEIRRVIVGHGATIAERPRETLAGVAAELG